MLEIISNLIGLYEHKIYPSGLSNYEKGLLFHKGYIKDIRNCYITDKGYKLLNDIIALGGK